MSSQTGRNFQAFTLRYKGRANQLVTAIQLFPAFDPTNPPAQKPPRFETTALWDTGASKSVISPAVVSALALTPVGTVNVSHAGGTSLSPTYLVNIGLPNRVGFAGILVSEFPSVGGAFEAIVGMDIISLGDLSLTNVGGKTCMSFRTPSTKENDFVAESNQRIFGKAGRNDPCPCGSKDADGRPKKFKLCHEPLLKL